MRSWFITGVSSGLGSALATAAIAAGDRVGGTVRSEAAAERFAAAGGRPFMLDVTDADAVPGVIAAADEALGGIEVLVNNAGYSLAGTIEETTAADIRGQIEANFFGPLSIIKAALPFMRPRRRGHIINVSSIAGWMTPGGIGAYGASKMALESLSDGLAAEIEPFGLHVTVVIPGAFRTDLGHSRRTGARGLADYAAQNRARDEFLQSFSTSQRGDPAKAAQAIIGAVRAVPPPRRLLLGPDAVQAMRTRLAALTAELDRWESVSTATDLA
ncbi:MAG TPA: oxidoreductase [Stellaceae bacterium]|nr:oxidoreductase [Stellaceae bacterium]